MNILVTGAAGFIGSHLAEHLHRGGHSVTGIDCLTDYYDRRLKQRNVADLAAVGVQVHPIDLAEGDIAGLAAEAEVVFHLAAQPGISATTGFADYVRNNVIATQRLIEAVRRGQRIRCFAYASTSSVYGAHATGDEETVPRPTSQYGVTKLAGEQLVLAAGRTLGLPCCSLRLFSVYGPRERPEKLYPRLIRAIHEGAEFPLFEGSEHHLRSYTYVADAVAGLAAVLDRLASINGEIINIGCDTQITTGRGIEIVEQIMGRKAKLRRLPPREGDQLNTHANITKARRLLGYAPTTPAERGLALQVEWMLRLTASGG